MASIQLRDGSTAEIPDGLSPDAMENFATRAQAAYDAAKTPAQSASATQPSFWDKVGAWMRQPAQGPDGQPELLPQTQPLIPRGQYPGLDAAMDWTSANVLHSAPVNFAGNVGADIAASPWDVPAGIANAVIHTAQNYGVNPNATSYPMAAPHIKADLGATPIALTSQGQRAETAAQIAATSGGGLVSRILSGIFGEAKGEVGSYAGGKIADVTDPRLREALQTGGAVAAQTVPGRKAVAPATGFFLGNQDAPKILDDT